MLKLSNAQHSHDGSQSLSPNHDPISPPWMKSTETILTEDNGGKILFWETQTCLSCCLWYQFTPIILRIYSSPPISYSIVSQKCYGYSFYSIAWFNFKI
jgi:hypothetical protein